MILGGGKIALVKRKHKNNKDTSAKKIKNYTSIRIKLKQKIKKENAKLKIILKKIKVQQIANKKIKMQMTKIIFEKYKETKENKKSKYLMNLLRKHQK